MLDVATGAVKICMAVVIFEKFPYSNISSPSSSSSALALVVE